MFNYKNTTFSETKTNESNPQPLLVACKVRKVFTNYVHYVMQYFFWKGIKFWERNWKSCTEKIEIVLGTIQVKKKVLHAIFVKQKYDF